MPRLRLRLPLERLRPLLDEEERERLRPTDEPDELRLRDRTFELELERFLERVRTERVELLSPLRLRISVRELSDFNAFLTRSQKPEDSCRRLRTRSRALPNVFRCRCSTL